MNEFSQYTVEYLSGAMSLRKPQKESLSILDEILNAINLKKGINLDEALEKVKSIRKTCTNFERDFMSLTFSLATGVGKTRLMGAFIAYLYMKHDIKNFFVVAPNTTIYEKIKNDLQQTSSPKYVFRGVEGIFNMTPKIFTEDDYKQISIDEKYGGVKIFLYNIDKFNKESSKMREDNEKIGGSFFEFLSNLPSLVLIMDESHHYRAERGATALNELNPVLGLELTATPIVNKGSRQIKFENVVYEYPLSSAIADGYTRTPYAMARANTDFHNVDEYFLDKLMLNDGIKNHEKIKLHLMVYAENHNKKLVKPFMLVVCKDTGHATEIEEYIKSEKFQNGKYINKVIRIDSKQKKTESEENIKLLLDVENPENPVEIVIHVNMLKEGWDVNNLYTIVPLRTAASKILREQMIGRGLRLPYGERTGDDEVDSVMLTAHDKFDEILAEAQKGDSIFKAGNVIKVEEVEEEFISRPQLNINFNAGTVRQKAYEFMGLAQNEKTDLIIDTANELIKNEVLNEIQNSEEHKVAPEAVKKIAEKAAEKISSNEELREIYQENENLFLPYLENRTQEIHSEAAKKFIPIPQIRIRHSGGEELIFNDFDLDFSDFNYFPADDELVIKSLIDFRGKEILPGDEIDLSDFNPVKYILDELKNMPEIDYAKYSKLLFKLIMSLCSFFQNKFGVNGMKKIILMNKPEIMNKIYGQMLRHVERREGFIFREVIGNRNWNKESDENCSRKINLYDDFETSKIKSIIFTGIKKGIFNEAKFDSREGELKFAQLLEDDKNIEAWLRPAVQEFDIKYNLDGTERNYIPDFIVETEKIIYMAEIKAGKNLENPETIEKKKAGIDYCRLVSEWEIRNGFREWRYLLIPAEEIKTRSTFNQLAQKYIC